MVYAPARDELFTGGAGHPALLNGNPVERQVRIACRDLFRKSGLLEKIIPDIADILKAGGLPEPEDAPEAAEPVIPREEAGGDDGHRG